MWSKKLPLDPRKRILDDRVLGYEWIDWDGDLERHEGIVKCGKRLFCGLGALVLLGYSSVAWVIWYLIAPRLETFGWWAPVASFFAAFAGIGVFWAGYYALVLTLILGKDFAPWMPYAAVIDGLQPGVFRFGRWLGISRDHLGSSFVHMHNALQRLRAPRVAPERCLVIMPRCLTRDAYNEIKELCDEYGCPVVTVGKGAMARREVFDMAPDAIIGIACERDLVTGINDVKARFAVLGQSIQRVEGPCKNARVDLNELRALIEGFVGPARRAARSDNVVDLRRRAPAGG